MCVSLNRTGPVVFLREMIEFSGKFGNLHSLLFRKG